MIDIIQKREKAKELRVMRSKMEQAEAAYNKDMKALVPAEWLTIIEGNIEDEALKRWLCNIVWYDYGSNHKDKNLKLMWGQFKDAFCPFEKNRKVTKAELRKGLRMIGYLNHTTRVVDEDFYNEG